MHVETLRRTCYRAVAQRPLPSLLAMREELEGVSSLLGAQEGGGEVLGPGSIVTTYSLVSASLHHLE